MDGVVGMMWFVCVDVLEEWGVSFGIGCNEGNEHVTMVLCFVDLVTLEGDYRVLSGLFSVLLLFLIVFVRLPEVGVEL